MKLRSILVGGLMILAGMLALPTIASWIVRDFLHQTMQVSGDFESVSIDPIKGNLVLNNFTLIGIDDDVASSLVPLMKVDKIWANCSLGQWLYRRFDSPLIAMDGVQICDCGQSAAMIPSFSKKAASKTEPEAPPTSTLSADAEADVAIAKVSFQRLLDQSAERSRVSKEYLLSEISRVEKDLRTLKTSPVDELNPLRGKLAAKRLIAELKKIEVRLAILEDSIVRESTRYSDTIPIFKESVSVDWIGWSRSLSSETDAIDNHEAVETMLAQYATNFIRPMIPPLITAHAISRWSVGEGNKTTSDSFISQQPTNIDFIADRENFPFQFRTIKFRGKTLIGPEPLSLNGTIKQISSTTTSTSASKSTTLELFLDNADRTLTKIAPDTPKPFLATSVYAPASRVHSIDLKYSIGSAVNHHFLGVGPEKLGVRAHLRATDPVLKLNWTLRDDRWECHLEMDCSALEIEFAGPSSDPALLPKTASSHANGNASVLWRWSKSSKPSETEVFQATYMGRLKNGRFDNCDEKIQSHHLPALASSLSEYWKLHSHRDTLASKTRWYEKAEAELSKWQVAQQSNATEIRKAFDKLRADVISDQSQLTTALQDRDQIRFSDKNFKQESGVLTR